LTGTAGITIKNLTKKYEGTVAVENLNLEIKDGEFFILLGPSGCGKSTALLCLAGLLEPDSGEILLGDKFVTSVERHIYVPPQKRGVAMVFQDYALYPHMSVFENIAFPLKVGGKSKADVETRVDAAAKSLGISQLLDRKPKQLSGGQRQRVALGRAIVREPEVFLMDEPLANLDAKLRVHMRAELKKLHQELGTTTVYVTHDQVEAMSMGDRIAILKDGILQQVGTPEDVYDHPRNMFVGGFIGSPAMNMLEGNLVKKDGNIQVNLGISAFELPDCAKEAVKEAKRSEVVLGVRPEHTRITKHQKNTIEAKVSFVELIGRELHVHLAAREEPLVAIAEPTERLEVGQQVWLAFDERKIHIFDKVTEEALI
jgi:multiple sugar transport system ATP-binding protein